MCACADMCVCVRVVGSKPEPAALLFPPKILIQKTQIKFRLTEIVKAIRVTLVST